jgi:hypothetical protein
MPPLCGGCTSNVNIDMNNHLKYRGEFERPHAVQGLVRAAPLRVHGRLEMRDTGMG